MMCLSMDGIYVDCVICDTECNAANGILIKSNLISFGAFYSLLVEIEKTEMLADYAVVLLLLCFVAPQNFSKSLHFDFWFRARLSGWLPNDFRRKKSG